jgi:hypothetical protein
MITDEPNPEEFGKKKVTGQEDIPGWGIDADPRNDPTYPIKNRKDLEHEGYNWERPALQVQKEEILKSVERPNLTATFGTSVPPSGWSGAIRRFAYKFSESNYARWMPLILADRVNMVEGLVDDLKKGHIPNLFTELGLKSEWKYNRKEFLRNILIGAIITTAVIAWCLPKRKKRETF